MIESIEPCGLFVKDLDIDGERRSDGTIAAHPNGIQLSQNRFLLLISTLGLRGVDDTRSICYQLREGNYNGPVIREGTFAQSIDDWEPLGNGKKYVRQFGHPVAFGVPKGALVNGAPAVNANCFVLKYRICARVRHPDGYLIWNQHPEELTEATQGVHWLQFRLSDDESNIEITSPARPIRQLGFEDGSQFCRHAQCQFVNQSYVQPIPYSDNFQEWAGVCHFNFQDMRHTAGSLQAVLKYKFNPASRLYEWIETSPLLRSEGHEMFEGGLVRHDERWIVFGRPIGGGSVGWLAIDDPFNDDLDQNWQFPASPQVNAPVTVYTCADGVLRLLCGAAGESEYGRNRLPLFCWDIDPKNDFAASNRRVVFDPLKNHVPITLENGPQVDFAKILPHAGGNTQWLLHRVRSNGLFCNDPDYGIRHILPEEFAATGIYAAKLHYTSPAKPLWEFEPQP